MHQLFRDVPSGTGKASRLSVTDKDLIRVLEKGPQWAVEHGMGSQADLDQTEENGCLAGADPFAVSERAKLRGKPQLGTLGSGNHFLEVQYVDEIFDAEAAARYNLEKNRIVVLIHTGSRGLGHQVCTDYVSQLDQAMRKYDLYVPDRQLACAPIHSSEGQRYLHEFPGRLVPLARLPSLDRHHTSLSRACDAGSRDSTLERGLDALGPLCCRRE